jgi:NAD(P)-dependent dehydrogenase (short-subunit alcohol dehydrogenase family)
VNDEPMSRRVAFVTGASQGIGAGIAAALARDGFDVAVSSTHPENLRPVLSSVEHAGARALGVALDVRSNDEIERAVDEVVSRLGRIDVLVNNAGVPLRRFALEVTPGDWDRVIGANLTGAFFVTQRVARHLVELGRAGCVINIGSTHGMVGRAERSTYGIAKAGLMHMTRMLAVEWAQYGIRVNAVAPGRVESGSPARAASASDPEYLKSMLDRVPLRRFCSVEEVAAAVCYLVAPSAEYVTGQTLVLDGGLTAA